MCQDPRQIRFEDEGKRRRKWSVVITRCGCADARHGGKLFTRWYYNRKTHRWGRRTGHGEYIRIAPEAVPDAVKLAVNVAEARRDPGPRAILADYLEEHGWKQEEVDVHRRAAKRLDAKPKPKPSAVERRAAAAAAGLERWEAKLKRAESKVKAYQRKVAYYQVAGRARAHA